MGREASNFGRFGRVRKTTNMEKACALGKRPL